MTEAEINAGLDRGVLPPGGGKLQPDQVVRWFKGMRDAQDHYNEVYEYKLRDTITELGGVTSYFLDRTRPGGVVEEVFSRLLDFTGHHMDLHNPYVEEVPDFLKFYETLLAEPLGYSTRNQTPGKDWACAEYYLVAATVRATAAQVRKLHWLGNPSIPDGVVHHVRVADFGYIEGPYNVCPGESLELEPGSRRRVWRFRCSANELTDLTGCNQNTLRNPPYGLRRDTSSKFTRLFIQGYHLI